MPAAWFVYLARCADDTLYCGVARDVPARIAQHDAGRGAKYTRNRGPLAVLLVRRCRDQGAALRLEHAIKQLSRARKLALVGQPARVAALVHAGAAARRAAAKRAVARAASGSASEIRSARSARPSVRPPVR